VKLPPEVIIDASRIFHPEDEDVLQDYDGIEEHERIRLDDWSDQTDEETNILRINLTNIFLRFLIEKLGLLINYLKNCPKLSKTVQNCPKLNILNLSILCPKYKLASKGLRSNFKKPSS